MTFIRIEQELSEGEPWSITQTAISTSEASIFDVWDVETHRDYLSEHELMQSDQHLQRESHHLLDVNPDSTLM